MSNILDLSIHNSKLARKLTKIDAEAEADNEFVLAYSNINFKESAASPGIYTAITKKVSDIAFGKLKFTPKAEKKQTKTGGYVTHFNVVYGTLMVTVDKKRTLVKTGFYFQVDQDTNYSIMNLRDDDAILDFTIVKNAID